MRSNENGGPSPHHERSTRDDLWRAGNIAVSGSGATTQSSTSPQAKTNAAGQATSPHRLTQDACLLATATDLESALQRQTLAFAPLAVECFPFPPQQTRLTKYKRV